MRKQNNRPVVIPLGEPMVKLAAFAAVVALVVGLIAGISALIAWIAG